MDTKKTDIFIGLKVDRYEVWLVFVLIFMLLIFSKRYAVNFYRLQNQKRKRANAQKIKVDKGEMLQEFGLSWQAMQCQEGS